MNFGGTVTSESGSFLTSQSAYSAITGLVTVDGSVILGNNASFAGGINASGISIGANTLTATGGTITGDITGTGGTFNVGTGNVTLAGNVGVNGASLSAVNFGTNVTLTVSGGSSIYAPITATNVGGTGSGLLKVTGGNVNIYSSIGTSGYHVGELYINDASTVSVNGNIYADYIVLANTGAVLTVTGGSSGTPNIVSNNVYSTAGIDGAGAGIVTVGDGTLASHVNLIGGMGPGTNQPAQLLTITGSSNAGNASTATISGKSFFNAGTSGSSGISIGQNATLTSTAALSFQGGAGIVIGQGATLNTSVASSFSSGTITAAVAGSGTYVITNTTVPTTVGTTKSPLGKVQLSNFNSGNAAQLGNAVNATTLDLINNSTVILDSNATGITNFTNNSLNIS